MIRVIVKTENVNNRAGTAKNGKAYAFREQFAALDDGHDFPAPFRLRLEKDQPAYKPGLYTFAPQSYRVNEYGDVELRYASLVPLDAKPATPAKAA